MNDENIIASLEVINKKSEVAQEILDSDDSTVKENPDNNSDITLLEF